MPITINIFIISSFVKISKTVVPSAQKLFANLTKYFNQNKVISDELYEFLSNVILYGTLLGRSPKEMEPRVKRIAEWADIAESIDLPLRTYSSGMVAKLAFAVATDEKSDVILVDEVLSVGDAEFQERSKARMRELFQSESAVVLVTHDAQSVRELATKALWIDHGRVMKYGEVNPVLDAYLNA